MTSLRRRLLVWLLGGLLLAGLAAAAATYFKAWEEVNELLDDQLQQVGFSLQHPSAFPMGVPDDDQGEEEESEEHLTVQIWDQHGVLRYRSRHHPLPPRQSQAGFHTLLWSHRLWRIFVIIRPHRTIQVSQSLDTRLKMVTGFALRVIVPIAGLIPLLALLIWIAVGRALRPLNDITAALSKRSAGALAPVPDTRLPDEIRPLVNALNSLLARLEQAFAQQRKFVA
ncbi:MAG TPA: two-component sensor histidine kinase, partial [Betaproteobacteria bacterium]|nr:two-component sensor histidine kinase [Betaproteobacteria bacterium]